jgi:hypothetical protein
MDLLRTNMVVVKNTVTINYPCLVHWKTLKHCYRKYLSFYWFSFSVFQSVIPVSHRTTLWTSNMALCTCCATTQILSFNCLYGCSLFLHSLDIHCLHCYSNTTHFTLPSCAVRSTLAGSQLHQHYTITPSIQHFLLSSQCCHCPLHKINSCSRLTLTCGVGSRTVCCCLVMWSQSYTNMPVHRLLVVCRLGGDWGVAGARSSRILWQYKWGSWWTKEKIRMRKLILSSKLLVFHVLSKH